MSTTFSASTLQNFFGDFHPRKLLLQTPLSKQPFIVSPPSINAPEPSGSDANDYLDANVVLVLSVLVCAVIFSRGLHFLVECAFQCLNSGHDTGLAGSAGTTTRTVNTGVKQKTLRTFLIMDFLPGNKLPTLDAECVICLSKFVIGDPVRILPKCNHGFHVKCIDRWLSSHSSCPTCRHSLVETCLKVEDCSQASSSQQPPVAQESIIAITSLEREGLAGSYNELGK